MQRIEAVNPAEMTGRAKDILDGVKKRLGRVPNVHATMANAPAVLEAYTCFGEAMGRASLDPKLRELVAIAVSAANECEYCLSAHTAIGRSLKVDDNLLQKAQDGEAGDPKTREALRFARSLVEKRGRVSSADLQQLKAAGFGDAQALELVGVVIHTIFTNYVNLAAGTEVDFPRVGLHARR